MLTKCIYHQLPWMSWHHLGLSPCWGINVIGLVEPTTSHKHRFILVSIDYSTKSVEVALYANAPKQVVARFLKKEIICCYGFPTRLLPTMDWILIKKLTKELCQSFKIEHRDSSPYHPKMNGIVEAANKNIKNIVQNMVKTYKDWHEMLIFALHGFRTSIHTSIG